MSAQRILVVGLNYAPEHTGIAPYTTGMARGLSSQYEVQVVTAHPHYPEWRIADGYGSWRTDELDGAVRVRRLRHYVPSNPTGATRILSEASFGARVLASRLRRPDAVVTVSPALLPVLTARVLAARWGVPIGVVVQDLYSRAVEEAEVLGGRGARAITRLESWALGGADALVAIHDRFRASMTRLLRIPESRISVIQNWTHVSTPTGERTETRRTMGWGDELVLLHAGNMGAKQGLDHLVEAAFLASRRGEKMRIVLMGNGSQRATLEERAAGVEALDIIDPVDSHAFPDVLAAADSLLLHERPGVEEMCVPSKLTSYFAAGRPVLAATSRRSAAASEVESSGAGTVIEPGNPEALVAAAKALRESDAANELGRRGQDYARHALSEDQALTAYRHWVASLLRLDE